MINVSSPARSNVGGKAASLTKNVYLSIPEGANTETLIHLKDLIDASQELGISIKSGNTMDIMNKVLGTADKLLTLTDDGIALSARYLDNFLQKNFNTSGLSSEKIRTGISKGSSVINALQSLLTTSFAGVTLNEIVNGDNPNGFDVAQGSLDVISKTFESVIASIDSVDNFSNAIVNIGKQIQNVKGLEGLSSSLQKFQDLNSGTKLAIFDGATGILGGISSGLILADPRSEKGEKIAAGVDLANKLIGNITKTVSQISLAQRISSGASITGPAIGLISSSVSLAISPLAFYGIAKKFDTSKEIRQNAVKYTENGYDGDILLADFYKGSGAADAAFTTVNTVLGAVSAGVGAASVASVVGAPIAGLVATITGVITGILEVSKQAAFEGIASKYQQKILAWEESHPGENYFDVGYNSRHKALLKDGEEFLREVSKSFGKFGEESITVITQQNWDSQLAELAGITKLGEKLSSGKVYADIVENGVVADVRKKEVLLDASNGHIVLESSNHNQVLTFLTPLMSSTTEEHERINVGKNEYINKLKLGALRGWEVTDVGNTNTLVDVSKVVQHFVDSEGAHQDIPLVLNLGGGDDVVSMGYGKTIVNGGEGTDIVDYSKMENGGAEFVSINGESGNYLVSRGVDGNAYVEEVNTYTTNVGKRTEKIEYRDVVLKNSSYQVTDELYSVENVLGTNWNDIFKGGSQSDVFYGGRGNDVINGNDGNDQLFGGEGKDIINGGDGDDVLSGGQHDDMLNGGLGNDFYLFSRGDGYDSITESGGTNDMLILDGIKSTELSFRRIGDSLELQVVSAPDVTNKSWKDGVKFNDWFLSRDNVTEQSNYENNYKVEAIVTGDGNVITSDKIDALIASMSSFNVADVINTPDRIFDDNLSHKLASSSLA
ncbi:hypothetical protein AII34_21045 [Salmonella enterica]|nr:hypothetical protein [Salmonella enterica]EAZ9261383.1 hypothetical protein [Salmonella enterica]EBN2521028.1 hypothetical protein [Salmonella enterica]